MARATLDDLISAWEPRLRAAFMEAIYNIRDQAQIEQIAVMIAQNNIEGAIRAVGLDPAQWRPFDKAISQSFEAGGELTAGAIPATIDANGFRTIFNFAIRNPAAETWLRNYSSELVREITDDIQTAIRNNLTAGLEQGLNPRTMALDLVGRIGASGNREGGIIGLTSSQEEWVRNYEAELRSDNPAAALDRLLRDARFDRAVLAAENNGEPISDSLISKMVTAYRNRALRYRAETIARKETITSLHTAQEQAMQQAIASGAIARDQVSYIWHTAHDNRVRETHIPMDGQVRKMGQMFTTGAGVELRYPGDPSGPAAEVINCRCWREPHVNFLAGIK